MVQGAGRAFSTGYDITVGGTGGGGVTGDRDGLERIMRGWLRIWDLRLAVVAKVHGYCLAGGTQLATICDITFVADDCKVGTPQAPHSAQASSAPPGRWLVGPKRAKEMFFPTGEMITGAEATDWGLFKPVGARRRARRCGRRLRGQGRQDARRRSSRCRSSR